LAPLLKKKTKNPKELIVRRPPSKEMYPNHQRKIRRRW